MISQFKTLPVLIPAAHGIFTDLAEPHLQPEEHESHMYH